MLVFCVGGSYKQEPNVAATNGSVTYKASVSVSLPSFSENCSTALLDSSTDYRTLTNPFSKSVKKFQMWLQSGKFIMPCTRRRKYILWLSAILNRHNSALFEWNCIRVAQKVQTLREGGKILCYRYIAYLVSPQQHWHFKSWRLVYVPPGLTLTNSTFCPQSVFMYFFLWIRDQTMIISLHSINWMVFVTEMERVYRAVRTGSLNKTDYVSLLKG
jgi:hypothetical protein